MKTSSALAILCAAMAAASWAPSAGADSAYATCEVRKDGDKQKGKSGPCTFGQRQGYIAIDLRNGDTYNLRPADKPNHFRDQKGNKVVRTAYGGQSQEFKWEGGKKVVVTFTGHAYGHDNHKQSQHDDKPDRYEKGG